MDDVQPAAAAGAGLHQLVDRLSASVVGRVREIELTVAAIASDRHIVIEGPPGTGKSTLLRAVARELGIGFEFVEGNAELAANPELINQDCYGRGWLMRVQPASATALEALLSPEAYSAVRASAEA